VHLAPSHSTAAARRAAAAEISGAPLSHRGETFACVPCKAQRSVIMFFSSVSRLAPRCVVRLCREYPERCAQQRFGVSNVVCNDLIVTLDRLHLRRAQMCVRLRHEFEDLLIRRHEPSSGKG
jgi:hypothetical protein